MNKRVFIIHGWGGSPDGDWFPWLKSELTAQSFDVFVPAMPDSPHPKIDDWIAEIQKQVGEADSNTYFVGHSIGCQAVLRYLELLSEDVKVGGVVLVAAWVHLTDETWDEDYTEEIAQPWLSTPINFDRIKNHTDKFIVIQSDDDPYMPILDAEIFVEKLGAKIIWEHKKGHVSAEDGVTELPSALNAIIIEISK